jgi:hypothetical protein
MFSDTELRAMFSRGASMSASSHVQQINRDLACRVNEEARHGPTSPYAGKFVGIANGQVVAVSSDLDEMTRRLRSIEPDPQNAFCFEAGLDYETAQHVWRACFGLER